MKGMKDLHWLFFLLIPLVVLALSFEPGVAQEQTAKKDTTVARDTSRTAIVPPRRNQEFQEIILETIQIEAVIEKPSVTLIPKRAKTDVGEVPFRPRSFDRELKEKPGVLSSYGQELENAKRIKKIKKALAKENK